LKLEKELSIMMKMNNYMEVYKMLFEGGEPEVDYMEPKAKEIIQKWFKEGKTVSIANTLSDNAGTELYIEPAYLEPLRLRMKNEVIFEGLGYYFFRDIIVIEDDTPGLYFKWVIKVSLI
jgi:hypothetical protein